MSRPRSPVKRESTRAWLSGLAIIVTSLTALFAFWRLSPGWTFLVAVGALICLIAALWIAGKDP